METPEDLNEPDRATIDAMTDPVILEFGTSWCGHCRAAQPFIAAVLKQHPNLRHIKVEDGKGRPLGRSFRVKLWPTLVFMKQGVEVERLVRPVDSESIAKACALIDSAS